MNRPIRFGVVGCGSIGGRHLAVVAAQPNASIAGVCDVDPAACARAVGHHGALPVYSDYQQFLEDVEADVIDICTPHALHAPMAIAAAESGRHVLVEKPMALTTSDAQGMIDAANRNGVRLMVVKQNRYNQPVVLTRRVLEGGQLGRVFMVLCNVLWNRHEAYYRESPWRGRKALEGGALFTQVSHFVDLLIWWFGDIVSASAEVATRNHEIEVEDCGTAHVTFSSGVMGQFAWTTCVSGHNYEGSVTIIGEKGTIKIGGQYLNSIEHWDVEGYPLPRDIEFSDKPNGYGGKYQGTSSNHDKVIRDLVADLLEHRHTTVTGDEGMRTVRAIELIYSNATVVRA